MRDLWEALKAILWFLASLAEIILVAILFIWVIYGVFLLFHILTHLSTAGV